MVFAARAHTDNVGGNAKIEYDFSEHGGVVGDNALPFVLPAGAIVYAGMIDVITAPTSGGSATVALKLEGAGDILAATAIGSLTGLVDVVPDGTAGNAVKTTVERQLQLTVATAALTAGKMIIHLDYYLR